MIHQIRKMVGLIIAIVRGRTPETTLVEAFQRRKVDIPKAPALGLLLENVFFDSYNKKYASDGSHAALKWEECSERVEEFKKQHIHRSIIDTEIREMSMMQWIGSLQIHEFYQTRQRIADAQEAKPVPPPPDTDTPTEKESETQMQTEN
jgi:tRNA pseudouridine38-40 synthase